MFLPDGPNQAQPPSGVADITPAEPETTSTDIALMQRVLSAASRNVNLIPSDFMAYIVDFIQTSRLQIPIGQVPGYSQSIPAGVIWPLGGAAIPSGWLLCDSAPYSRAQYSALFNEIGTAYGAGDGSTTFNVPDLRGRVPVGYAASGGHADVSTLGNNDGVVPANRRPKHQHTPHSHPLTVQTFVAGGSTVPQLNTNVQTQSISTGAADGGSGNANDSLDAPAFVVVNFIIKT